ncbi:Lrp/AsnC family transcriptional regulator [Paracoccus sp. MBLB3053]|uniref:Lrp/AsnC family transcriptional regulator n=1 Tax=Paracoccus aurantius TaxID=3073814 RepID=A0ABU2HWL8_9RHOB|nr:Lrp/AsnC family transcriptional regulator [Paracoccus sp. MBLB3053]MDS9468999.1 Lrp/AsnC family transcriptional regulator [Paracoccus sp. MBLB3053]
MHLLDDLDRRLIAALREDGRAPVSKLATILGVSRATVQTRLDRLMDTGAVLGFTIRARENVTEAVQAVMLIEVNGRSTTQVIRALRGLPELHSLHSTNGKWDLVAQLAADNLPHFDRVLREVREIQGITNSETSILLSQV